MCGRGRTRGRIPNRDTKGVQTNPPHGISTGPNPRIAFHAGSLESMEYCRAHADDASPSSGRADQSLDEGMRERHPRHSLDFLHIEDPQVRLPLMELEQPIMIRTHVLRRSVAACRAVEEATQPDAIHRAAVHAKAHQAAREVVHVAGVTPPINKGFRSGLRPLDGHHRTREYLPARVGRIRRACLLPGGARRGARGRKSGQPLDCRPAFGSRLRARQGSGRPALGPGTQRIHADAHQVGKDCQRSLAPDTCPGEIAKH
jgi:hypothetical protein